MIKYSLGCYDKKYIDLIGNLCTNKGVPYSTKSVGEYFGDGTFSNKDFGFTDNDVVFLIPGIGGMTRRLDIDSYSFHDLIFSNHSYTNSKEDKKVLELLGEFVEECRCEIYYKPMLVLLEVIVAVSKGKMDRFEVAPNYSENGIYADITVEYGGILFCFVIGLDNKYFVYDKNILDLDSELVRRLAHIVI